MKQLIVGIALFIIFSMGTVYQADYSKVKAAEDTLKRQTDDSASGVIFCIDALKYAEGDIIFDDNNVLEYARNTLPPDYETIVTIFDDGMRKYKDGVLFGSAGGITYPYHYTDENGYYALVNGPAIAITAIKKTNDLYRLPFLTKTEIKRSSMYTFEGRK